MQGILLPTLHELSLVIFGLSRFRMAFILTSILANSLCREHGLLSMLHNQIMSYLQIQLLSEAPHTAPLFENGSSLPWMVRILSSFYPYIFPTFGKQKASKDCIYDAIAVGLGNGIPNKLPMLKNSFL